MVSVIIPVYNAENSLHICLESLQKQDYSSLELIFVNDCSSDKSLEKIEIFRKEMISNTFMQIIICNHEVNQGVAAARNTGLDCAKGEFIYYVDADDALETDAISKSVRFAIEKNFDIVGFNWFLTFNDNERKMNQPTFNSSWQAIELMLSGKMRWNLWLFMAKRSLYEDYGIRFIPGMNMGEDLLVTIKLFDKAERVAYLDEAFYHYGQSNINSLTKTYSEKHILEVSTNVLEVETYLKNSKFNSQLGNLINLLKLNIKLPLLISDKIENYKQWFAWFPESNSYTLMNKHLPFRTRCLQWLAAHRQYWALKLYYKIIIKLVYGIIYK